MLICTAKEELGYETMSYVCSSEKGKKVEEYDKTNPHTNSSRIKLVVVLSVMQNFFGRKFRGVLEYFGPKNALGIEVPIN